MVIIGGGVAGYVAAIKAGQEGLKVYSSSPRKAGDKHPNFNFRLPVSRSAELWEAHV